MTLVRFLAKPIVVISFALGITSCTAPPPPLPTIATVQPGDSQLSCADVSSQMGQMDQIMAQKADTGVSALTFVPIVGEVATLSNINSHTAKLEDQATQKSQAMQRKQRLVQLYTDQKC